jgi:hypothetical protein
MDMADSPHGWSLRRVGQTSRFDPGFLGGNRRAGNCRADRATWFLMPLLTARGVGVVSHEHEANQEIPFAQVAYAVTALDTSRQPLAYARGYREVA